jgi:hypothetical protein
MTAVACGQACIQDHLSTSFVADILIGLFLLVLWLNWRSGHIQAGLNALGAKGRSSFFAAFFVFAPIFLDIGLDLDHRITLLSPLLSAIIALTVRELFAYEKGREEIRSEIIVELMSNIRSLRDILSTIEGIDPAVFRGVGLDQSWAKSFNIIWKNSAMKKHFTKAIAQRVFCEEALRRAEERYSVIEILALKAEAQIEGFNSYELVRFNLTVARDQLLETAKELQADYKVESL